MIRFTNSGIIDIKGAMTFGVSAKQHENPFGQFGTGLKYAIAILLRTHHDVCIIAGNQRYDFGVEAQPFRDQEFMAVTMNGSPTGFTTHLGEHWEVWQAYRELLCNAMDETEWSVARVNLVTANAGDATSIYVDGDEIHMVHDNRDDNFLFGETPVYKLAHGVEVYNRGPRHTEGIFVKGVRVGEYEYQRYSYNFTSYLPDLSEDRGLRTSYETPGIIGRATSSCTDKDAIMSLVVKPQDEITYFEDTFPYDTVASSVAFKEAASECLRNKKLLISRNAMKVFYKMGLAAGELEPYTLTAREQQMFDRASAFLATLNYFTDKHNICFVEELGLGEMANTHASTKRITVSKECFVKGTRYLTSTLLEEIVHAETGYADLTRPLQTFLFDLVIKQVEEATGELL